MTSAEVRACVEDEHGYVTSTDVPDDEAEFFSVYEPDSDGLPRAVSDHPTREAVQRALEDRQGVAVGQAAAPVSEDQAACGARPALLPPAPGTAEPRDAGARSTGMAPNARGVGR